MTSQPRPAIVEIAYRVNSDDAPLVIGLSRKDRDFDDLIHLFPTQAGIAASVKVDLADGPIGTTISAAISAASEDILDQFDALSMTADLPEPWKVTIIDIGQSLAALASPIGPDEDQLVSA